MSISKIKAGRLGGLATKEKYGVEFFKINGTRGGRPHTLTIEDINRQSQPLKESEGGMDTPLPDSLKKLRRLWRDRQKSTASGQILTAEVGSGSRPEQPLPEGEGGICVSSYPG